MECLEVDVDGTAANGNDAVWKRRVRHYSGLKRNSELTEAVVLAAHRLGSARVASNADDLFL